MKFLVDNQLPISLAKFLREQGHDAVHASDAGLDEAEDRQLWNEAIRTDRVVVSKDEDLFILANRAGDSGRLLWVRLGNCRNAKLKEVLAGSLEVVVAAFESEQRIVELS